MNTLNNIVRQSEQNVHKLSHTGYLRHAAEQISSIATMTGANTLLAASPEAGMLVGAVTLFQPSLRSSTVKLQADSPVGNVLVVDINLSSGTSIARAAQEARAKGAHAVNGAVMQIFNDQISAQDCHLDTLEIID